MWDRLCLQLADSVEMGSHIRDCLAVELDLQNSVKLVSLPILVPHC